LTRPGRSLGGVGYLFEVVFAGVSLAIVWGAHLGGTHSHPHEPIAVHTTAAEV
jgi:hypothetical protein